MKGAKTMATSKKHPGFAKAASSIARKEGISKQSASAILASSTRNASAAAKRKNPRLKNVPKKKK
jgi:hypothetical protein